jgi:hypothetical protein
LPATAAGASTTVLPAAALPAKAADVLGKWPIEEVEVPIIDLSSMPRIFQCNVFGGVDLHNKYKPPFMPRAPNEHVTRDEK